MARRAAPPSAASRSPRPEFYRATAQGGSSLVRNLLTLLVLMVALGLGLRFVIPEWQRYQKKKEELAEVAQIERQVREQRERSEAEEKALRENPFYLESRARERLPLYRPGETVVKIER